VTALFKGQFTTAQMGEDAAPRGWGVGGGVPSTENFSILALNMVSLGAFWVVFFTVQLPVLHAKPVKFGAPPIFFLNFRFKKVHFLAFWRRQKFHAAGPVLVRPSECITLHL